MIALKKKKQPKRFFNGVRSLNICHAAICWAPGSSRAWGRGAGSRRGKSTPKVRPFVGSGMRSDANWDLKPNSGMENRGGAGSQMYMKNVRTGAFSQSGEKRLSRWNDLG